MSSTPRETSATVRPASSTLLRPDAAATGGKRERTRRVLLNAAVDAIADVGEAITILDVTRRAGVSNGTFYNHFPDRDALVEAVAAEVLAAFTANSDQLVDVDDPALRFATISALVFETADAFPELAKVMLRLDDMIGLRSGPSDPFGFLRADLTEGVRRGRFQPLEPDAALDVVVGSMQRCVRRRIEEVPLSDDHDIGVLALMLRALGIEPKEATTIATDAVSSAARLWTDE